ncbi:hypothetical protein AKJ61_03340 [candidate division MSBL1 archaeon SCGC-AAA259B11]|uniref:Cysteine-rich domain-containing protein n=1 Tax=candidate division MSBL1 archaeon SCGC-AAA259B11 TaxID=1698260 RepID=A0A133U4V1_9EURY|nr:hypothetical protein AKJ61_03340 [candidate division MSBL1 archaeon SCGC-AAA259B11]
MKEYAYYPGCSLKGSAENYENSLFKVFKVLEIDLEELEDWNCCGATLFYSTDELKAYGLSARNLALAEQTGKDIIAPCSACYHTLKKTQKRLRENSSDREKVNRALEQVGLDYRDCVEVKHPLEVVIEVIGLEKIKKKIEGGLEDLKIAPYYGCLFARPHGVGDPHFPNYMDQLIDAIGGEVIDYPVKTRCCGGLQSYIYREAGLELIYILLNEAERREADAIMTLCPFCHLNLEILQKECRKSYDLHSQLPIVYFTQLLGLSLGIDERDLEFSKSVIPLDQILSKMEGIKSEQ